MLQEKWATKCKLVENFQSIQSLSDWDDNVAIIVSQLRVNSKDSKF